MVKNKPTTISNKIKEITRKDDLTIGKMIETVKEKGIGVRIERSISVWDTSKNKTPRKKK